MALALTINLITGTDGFSESQNEEKRNSFLFLFNLFLRERERARASERTPPPVHFPNAGNGKDAGVRSWS